MCGRGEELAPPPPGLAVRFLLGDPMTPPPPDRCPDVNEEVEEGTVDVAIDSNTAPSLEDDVTDDPLDCCKRLSCCCWEPVCW